MTFGFDDTIARQRVSQSSNFESSYPVMTLHKTKRLMKMCQKTNKVLNKIKQLNKMLNKINKQNTTKYLA